ncbi:MAG: hypothetical protein JXQ73_08000, partial [Phycisphaerae bacterium]|nr:hypothetical protein [Phycisphaerae bacterium]
AGEEAYALARPAEGIDTSELLAVAQRLADGAEDEPTKAGAWVQRFREAQLKLPVHDSLASL